MGVWNNTDSILDSTKKILGIAPDYSAFDIDVITHINSAFFILNQLGVGPPDGFVIEDNTAEWGEFLGDDPKKLSSVRTYVYLRVRLLFDPPTTSFAIEAATKQAQEYEWRLSVNREEHAWVNPNPPTPEVFYGE